MAAIPKYSSGSWFQIAWTTWIRATKFEPAWLGPWSIVPLALLAAGGCALMVRRDRRQLRLLGLVLFVVAKGIFWAAMVPALQSPDEASHYQYAQVLVENRRLPTASPTDERLSEAGYSPEVKQAIRVGGLRKQPPGDRPDFGGPDPYSPSTSDRSMSNGRPKSGAYSPAYYGPAALFYLLAPNRFPDRIAMMRLWSVLLGAVAALGCFRLGRLLFRSDSAGLMLAVAVSLQPIWSQQTAVVNNDALVAAAGAWILYYSARILRSSVVDAGGPARRDLAVSGALGALALLAKPTMASVVLLLPLSVAFGFVMTRGRHAERRWQKAAVDMSLVTLPTVALYGVWMLTRAALGLGAQSLKGEYPYGTSASYLRQLTVNGFADLRLTWVEQLWGGLGLLNAALFPHRLINFVELATVLTAVAGVVLLGKWWSGRGSVGSGPSESTSDRCLLVLMVLAVATTVVFLHVVEWRYFEINGRTLLQGRYLLPVIPALLAIPPLVARGLWPRLRAVTAVAPVLVVTAVFQLTAISWLAFRFYV